MVIALRTAVLDVPYSDDITTPLVHTTTIFPILGRKASKAFPRRINERKKKGKTDEKRERSMRALIKHAILVCGFTLELIIL